VFNGDTGVRSFSEDVFDWSAFTSAHAGQGPTRYLSAIRECVSGDCDTVESLRRGLLLKLHDANLWTPTDSGATAAMQWLRNRTYDDDAFVFLNLMEAHDPYDRIPRSYRTDPEYDPPENIGLQHSFDPPDREGVTTAYDDAVRYLSDVYRDVFEELRSDMDCIVTVSDHGELLGEHGQWGHTYGLYSEVTHVPLVVWTGGDVRESIAEQVSLLDVHATIADAADVAVDGRGHSLLDAFKPTSRLVEGHGLTSHRRSRLKADGHDIAAYDTDLRGIAVPPDGFGHWLADEWEGMDVMPTYHPAYLLRSPNQKNKTWKDLQQVMERLGLERG